jgi:hypothetical protein
MCNVDPLPEESPNGLTLGLVLGSAMAFASLARAREAAARVEAHQVEADRVEAHQVEADRVLAETAQ